jgi:CAAX protease family protein
MHEGSAEQAVYLHLLAAGGGALLLANLALSAVLALGRATGRPLLARRWSAAHVLIGFQAWLLPTLLITAFGAAMALGPAASGGAAADAQRLGPVLIGGIIVQNAAMVGVVLVAVCRVYDQRLTAAGLSLRHWAPRVTIGLLAATILIPASLGLERLSATALRQLPLPSLLQRGYDSQMAQFLALFRGSGGLFLAILLIGIVAPFGEEVFFRGFAYRCFRTRWGPVAGSVGSAALFSLVHMHPLALLPIFVVGCALAYLYERTGTLVAPFVLHAVNNIAAVLILHFGRGG